MKVEIGNGKVVEIPDVGEYDKLGVVYNGGTTLYLKGKRKWTCPVCGKHTIDDPGHNDDCPICGWEDDACDLTHPDFALGENGVSYNQAKQLWEKYHDNIRNHKDEYRLTFGDPDLDKWIEDNAGKITADELMQKVQECFGDSDFEEETEETENS